MFFPERFGPKEITTLPRPEQNSLQKIQKILDQVSETIGVTEASVRLTVHEDGTDLILNKGSRSYTVLSVHRSILKGMQELWSKDLAIATHRDSLVKTIAAYPDGPDALLERIQKSDTKRLTPVHAGFILNPNMHATDDEIYFFLKHELAGHTLHHDNLKRFALTLLTTSICLAALPFFRSEGIAGNLIDVTALLVLSCFLQAIRCFYGRSQEFEADLKAVSGDERAMRGALSFFKREAIRELADKKMMEEITGKGLDFGGVLKFLWMLKTEITRAEHPSFEHRYRAIWAKFANK